MTEALGLAPVLRLVALVYYRWALKEIDPMHPDVHHIVHRINELERMA